MSDKPDEKKYYARVNLPDDVLKELEGSKEALKELIAKDLVDAFVKDQEEFEIFKEEVSKRVVTEIGGRLWWEYWPPDRYRVRWKETRRNDYDGRCNWI